MRTSTLKARKRPQRKQWLCSETGSKTVWGTAEVKEKPGISFGPEPAWLDEEVLVTMAKDPSPKDPTYWTPAVELYVFTGEDGALFVPPEAGGIA